MRCRCSTYSLTLRIVPCGVRVDVSGAGSRGHLGGPRQCLRIDVLLDVRHFAISNGNVEDPLVLVRLIRSIDFSRSDADDQNPSPCATNSGGFGYFISTSLDAFLSTAANSACPRYVPASGQPSPGMIHSISSAANASRSCSL